MLFRSPDQKVAPLQFEVEQNVLRLKHTPAIADDDDKLNAQSARSALIEQGRAIIDGLRKSNCDQRFTENVEQLQAKLESIEDVVQLGIFNLACEELRQQYDAELPDIIGPRLKSHLSSIGLYVAQFPEWGQFLDKANSVELSESDIRKAKDVAESIVSNFEKIPERVDPEVPKMIKAISGLIADPAHASKKAAYALLGTLENLFSKVMKYAATFADDLVCKTSTKVTDWGAKAIATLLIGAVLHGAGILTPVYSKFAGSIWVKSAVEAIQQLKLPD